MYQKSVSANKLYDFSILEELFRVKIKRKFNLSSLNLDNNIGVGFVKSLEHSNGIITLDFDLTLNETLDIPINFIELNTTQFIYVIKGDCDYIADSGDTITIKQFQTATSVSIPGLNPKLRFKKNTQVVLNIIDLRKSVYTKILGQKDCSFSSKVLTFINTINDSHRSFFIGSYNFKIAEYFKHYFQQTELNKNNGVLFFEGIIFLILSNHFQSVIDQNDQKEVSYLLNPTELNKINNLSDQIRENPEVQYSLNYLSSESGLSPAKLQEGFKYVFNRTVADFIRHVRLTKAEHLMYTTDLNISEIVYSIGFTSRSYFCKIFKREFNCSPKQYKNKIKKTTSLRIDDQ